MRSDQDSYGHAMYDFLRGKGGQEIVEYDDGFIFSTGGPSFYFAEFPKWSAAERTAMRSVVGRVLDVGCGAGRVAIHLQERGHDVLGIDNSPLAVRVARTRGLKHAKVLSISEIDARLRTFDTIVMMCNNFGLVGSRAAAKRLLGTFHRITSDRGRTLAASTDPRKGRSPHRAYHQRNRSRGRLPGQIRCRIRYRTYATPWADFLLVSRAEMRSLVRHTGWRIRRFVDAPHEPLYVAILEKE
ncbi:MAG: class I SAM-dependent methyltransferase [Actinobacteria bacterium]|nr:class I SAM-dependent methyltransferase [Actinomycetota bacterium]